MSSLQQLSSISKFLASGNHQKIRPGEDSLARTIRHHVAILYLRHNMRISSDHLNRINRAVNYINENPSQDLSLQRLADIANYSPFHFEKLFAAIVGETPKQYILRIRLDTAAHALVIFLHKSITEVALDSGFSSSATFSRAFRKYFGISPQELKRIPHRQRFSLYRQGKLGRHLLVGDRYFFDVSQTESWTPLDDRVIKMEAIRGIFVSCPPDNNAAVTSTFNKVSKLANVHDLISEQSKFIGALYLHQRLYQAIATVEHGKAIPRELNEKKTSAGRFAAVSVTGPVENTFAAMLAFANNWLPGKRLSHCRYLCI